MAVTKVDDRGRIKLPRDVVSPGESVIIIDANSYFLGIPIPLDPLMSSRSWLEENLDVKKLKQLADASASEDARSRAARRKQL